VITSPKDTTFMMMMMMMMDILYMLQRANNRLKPGYNQGSGDIT
jgi:hypothetical protein